MTQQITPLKPDSKATHSNQAGAKRKTPHAVIIAAGLGARLGTMTESLPKCLLTLNNKPIIEYQLDAFKANGIHDISVIKGHQADKINYPQLNSYINTNYQNNNILCSLMSASELMDDAFIASYSDIVYSSETVASLLNSPHDITVVVDMDWKGKYEGRTLHPESEAEKALVNHDGSVSKLGKGLETQPDSTQTIGEFIGLLMCSEKGALLFKQAFEKAKTEFEGQSFYNAASLEKAYITDMLNYLIDQGVSVHCARIQQGWYEIDTEQDLRNAEKWIQSLKKTPLQIQGQRILSELNDFKRTVASCAKELNWDEAEVQRIVKGNTTPERMNAFIDTMCKVYPLERADIELSMDDCVNGVKVMRMSESKTTARIFERKNKEGGLSPYYEYRDTATSRLCAFRPEWIQELRVVNDNDPYNPDAIYNNGHFMHQVTYFVGPVNFYYQLGDKKYCAEMNTGDSNYITPYFPHSFTSRNKDEEAYIVAVTFGGDVRRSLDELYRMGKNRAEQYLINTRKEAQGVQDLVDYHLGNELLTRSLLQEKLTANGHNFDITDRSKKLDHSQVEAIATALHISVLDLSLSEYNPDEDVVVSKMSEATPYAYPSESNARYQIWHGARCSRMPLVKAFHLKPLCTTPTEVPELSYGLHSYLYNYSENDAVLTYLYEGSIYTQTLSSGDSAYIQPFVKFSLSKIDLSHDTGIFIVGIPGSINPSVQKEMSAFAAFDRVVAEDKCWF